MSFSSERKASSYVCILNPNSVKQMLKPFAFDFNEL